MVMESEQQEPKYRQICLPCAPEAAVPSPVLSDEDLVGRGWEETDMDAGTHNPMARRTPGQREAGGGPDSGWGAGPQFAGPGAN